MLTLASLEAAQDTPSDAVTRVGAPDSGTAVTTLGKFRGRNWRSNLGNSAQCRQWSKTSAWQYSIGEEPNVLYSSCPWLTSMVSFERRTWNPGPTNRGHPSPDDQSYGKLFQITKTQEYCS